MDPSLFFFINKKQYYAPKMYERVLGSGRMPILMAGFTALAYFAGALLAIFLVDRAGRRKLFMSGSLAMVVWLILMGVFNKYDMGMTSAILVIVFTMIYVFTFGCSWACVVWLCKYIIMFFKVIQCNVSSSSPLLILFFTQILLKFSHFVHEPKECRWLFHPIGFVTLLSVSGHLNC